MRLYSSPQSPITFIRSFPLLETSCMLFTSSSSRTSENTALVSLICSDKPSRTPIIDPATAGCSSTYHTIPEEWKSIRNNAVDDLMRTQEARMYLIQYVFYSNSWNWDTMFIGYLFECLQQNLKLTPSPPSIHHLSFLL